ncbi:hypothetical protein L2744_09960 [Shewanella profunda]|uniref:fibrinogen-like YCDxxxxGGGW domain-containing protein n=1 Tax=Shewanella profunda TaxID=254793 RepID=UPI00201071DB|nr:fibrinogen-like YCDxxxxGGGW domain-containing protein [Shewanella profunda]MCL1089925.1 hypothetical protein [Shewanella profunda]
MYNGINGISVLFFMASFNCVADNWTIQFDELLDGSIENPSEILLDATVRKEVFVAEEDTITSGSYLFDKKLISFSRVNEYSVRYYLGTKKEYGYVGTWYDIDGRSGDWQLLSDSGNNIVKRTCNEILKTGNSVGDGYYTIDPDGEEVGVEPFEVYCDMTNQDGGWTLFAYHKDNIASKNSVETVSPGQLGVMEKMRWQALLASSEEGIMTIDQAGRKAMVTFSTMNKTQEKDRIESLAPDIVKAQYLWVAQHPTAGVNYVSAIIINSQDTSQNNTNYKINGASVYNSGHLKFDVWEYGSSPYGGHVYGSIDSLQYYIK